MLLLFPLSPASLHQVTFPNCSKVHRPVVNRKRRGHQRGNSTTCAEIVQSPLSSVQFTDNEESEHYLNFCVEKNVCRGQRVNSSKGILKGAVRVEAGHVGRKSWIAYKTHTDEAETGSGEKHGGRQSRDHKNEIVSYSANVWHKLNSFSVQ